MAACRSGSRVSTTTSTSEHPPPERAAAWDAFCDFVDWDLHKNWPLYYEGKDKYERLQQVRNAADPYRTFTPGPRRFGKRWL